MGYSANFNMPLFGKRKSKTSVYSKAKLEHQLYLARENPEPVFDLSECDLQTVPPGIYSLCKVFLKEALYLQNNQLIALNGGGRLQDLSLLQVLDAHSNCLKTIPDDIRYLKSLKVLNLSKNQLKCLPSTIGSLQQLQLLDVSDNQLTELPHEIANLHRLQELNIKGNKPLSSLPSSLCQARNLRTIHIDAESFKHPPKEIVKEGTESIMRFLAQGAGIQYQHPDSSTDGVDATSTNTPQCHLDGLQAKIMQLGKMKDLKNQDLLARTQEMEENQRKELELHAAHKQSKGRLLENILVNESKLESKIIRLQQDHEAERVRLVNNLLEVEKSSDEVISLLLALRGGTAQEPRVLQRLVEQERQAEQELLSAVHQNYESLRRRDILKAMEEVLEEEYRCEQKLREYEEGRAVTTKTLLSQEMDSDKQLSGLLVNQGEAQVALISRLQRHEELQRAAVGALLERGDARSWGLVQQVTLVEEQLAALTAVEMRRQKLQMDQQVSDLADKRVALSMLLVDLLDQQAVRRKELLRTMEEMERLRWVGDDGTDDHDYWLKQYQRLLDSRPGAIAEVERSLDPLLAQNLLFAGVIHYLPFLAETLGSADSLASMTDRALEELGISSADDRLAVLDAVGRYLQGRPHPAPVADAPGTTGTCVPQEPEPGIGRAECVVCMEVQCEVVFVPCGHMCCCIKCAETLKICPMCRASVQQKIRVILP